MEVLTSILPNFGQMLNYAVLFVAKGGWALFVAALVWMLWAEYLEEIQGQYVAATDWMFLEILPPKDNMVSTMAVESIFSQMHAMHSSLTLQEIYVEGRFQLWYSLELVSLGGRVSFLIRTPRRFRHLVESAFYAQYPGAEIREVQDYLANFQYNPFSDNNEYDIFGTEWKMEKSDVISLKTYKDFEHPSAEDKIIDPLNNFIESLERVGPREILAMQLLIQPIQNNEWAGRATAKIKELTGEEMPHRASFWHFLMTPFEWFAKFSYREALLGGHGHAESENKPRNNWLSMTEAEKEEVTLIEKKVNKPNYSSKLRLLYAGPKDIFDKNMLSDVVGALRHFSPGGGAGTHNTLKLDSRTLTKIDPKISPTLEKSMVDNTNKKRKYWFLRGYKNRSLHVGAKKFLLSVEEIATLFHFPITSETRQAPAQVVAVESKKSRPPANLPVAENS